MKRFTQYLYEYDQKKKIRNIGFVKGEFFQKSGQVRIQARGLQSDQEEGILLYLFYQGKEKTEAVYQGKIQHLRPVVNYRLEFSLEDIGNAENIDDIQGIFLVCGDRKKYAAVWSGEEIDIEEIELEEKKENDVENIEIKKESVEEIKESEQHICYTKIQRKDLSRLPRKEWRLANNSFLLHGYYNYHHILWIEEEGQLFIGVPGIYHEREFQAAKAFGFTEFRRIPEMFPQNEEEEGPEESGYFCRRIIED